MFQRILRVLEKLIVGVLLFNLFFFLNLQKGIFVIVQV